MEGKLVWKLLDLVKSFREQQDTLKKQGNDIGGPKKFQFDLQAGIYKEVADKLENLLKELYSK